MERNDIGAIEEAEIKRLGFSYLHISLLAYFCFDVVMGADKNKSSLFRVGVNVDFFLVMELLTGVVVFVMILELFLHRTDHYLERHPKYREMLRKVFGGEHLFKFVTFDKFLIFSDLCLLEFMILGFVGLLIKLAKEIFSVDPYADWMIGLQVADLIVFLVAVGLVIQSIVIFLLVRKKNIQLEKGDLVSTKYLIDLIEKRSAETKRASMIELITGNFHHKEESISTSDIPVVVELKIFRYFFLRKYNLPELFPFAQYLRYAENNQISHMIEVQFSTWLCLIMVALLLEVASRIGFELLEEWEENPFEITSKQDAVILAYVVFSVVLVIFHILVKWYLNGALLELLRFTLSKDLEEYQGPINTPTLEETSLLSCKKRALISNERFKKLHFIAKVETSSMQQENTSNAIAMLEIIRDQRSKVMGNFIDKYGHGASGPIHDDIGFQLLRKVFLFIINCGRLPASQKPDAISAHRVPLDHSVRTTQSSNANGIEVSGILGDGYTTWKPRMYSRKAWHFVVMSLLMLNAFYFSLYCECIIFQLKRIYHSYGLAPVVLIPLPLFINVLVLQAPIFKNFILISSICRFDDAAYGEVVDHLTETLQLRSEFIMCVREHMKTHNWSREDLHAAFMEHDPSRIGSITIDDMRLVLQSFGYSLSYFRFNNIVRVLFETRGFHVKYNQVERLLFVGDGMIEELNHASKAQGLTESEPSLHRGDTIPAASPSYTPYTARESVIRRVSSRALTNLYNLDYIDGSSVVIRDEPLERMKSSISDDYIKM